MVYLYHRIGDAGEHPFLDKGGSPVTTEKELSSDLTFLKQQGAQFIRFKDLLEHNFSTDEFTVIICFDDCFSSNYHRGLSLLEKMDVPATFFQSTALIDAEELLWEHALYWLAFDPQLSSKFWSLVMSLGWQSVQRGQVDTIRDHVHPDKIMQCIHVFGQMHPGVSKQMMRKARQLYPLTADVYRANREGHEIASHGHQHWLRSMVSDGEFECDLKVSLKKLQGLEVQAQSFSYPFNSYLEQDKKLVGRHFDFVATVDGGAINKQSNHLALPRNTWPGPAKNRLRQRRWLLTGKV